MIGGAQSTSDVGGRNKMATDMLKGVLHRFDPDLFPRLMREITGEVMLRYLRPLADTRAPSQSVPWTRGPVIASLLAADGVLNAPGVSIDTNFEHTGNTVLTLGDNPRRKRIWLLAHLDEISYAVYRSEGRRFQLTPLCYHMMEPGRQDGVVLRYDLRSQRYQPFCDGDIVVESNATVYFETSTGAILLPGDRVCFQSKMFYDPTRGIISGSLDDAGGAAALLVATRFLQPYGLELLLALTDEEEGVGGIGNQSFCRGGSRLLPYFDQPELVIDCDIHEAEVMLEGNGPIAFAPGDGASYAEVSSYGKGVITPPHLYALVRQLSIDLAPEKIRLRENVGGYLSRSEGVNAMLRTPNVALLGFVGANRHFQTSATTANLNDLVDLARSVVCLVLLTQTPLWREVWQ